MIHTRVKHRKEDYLYIAKNGRWSGENLVVYLLEILCGVAIFHEILPMMKAVFLYHQSYGIKDMILMCLTLVVALGCIATPFLSPYFVAWKLHRRYKKDYSTQELFWGEEEVLSKASREGISEESHIAYSVMDRYFEQNEAIYIRLKSEKANLYLVVRDDGYLEGSKAELLTLLEGKYILKG